MLLLWKQEWKKSNCIIIFFRIFALKILPNNYFFLILQRIQTGILKAFNNPTTKTADEETRRKVKGMQCFIESVYKMHAFLNTIFFKIDYCKQQSQGIVVLKYF